MNKLILIDGNSLINRAFYATPIMTTKSGEPTNAVFAFINMLLKLINNEKPNYMLVAFDRKEPTFRHKMYGEYKGTRKPMPEELRPQIETLKTVLDALGIARYEQAGIEADDIIGSVAKKFNILTCIVTGDRDSFQLVDSTTTVYFTKRGITDLDIYDAQNFKEKMGIEPIEIIDLKACMGDSSDNIPGMKGVGEKTALTLIQKYSNIENIYNNVEDFSGKLKEKIIESEEIARLSKTLATIDTKIDVPISLEDMKIEFPFKASAKNIFSKLEFRNLLKKDSIFNDDSQEEQISEMQVEVKTIIERAEISSLLDANKTVGFVVSNDIHFCFGDNLEYVIKIKDNFFDEGFIFDEALNVLKPYLENKDYKFIVFSKKQLKREFNEFGVSVNAFCEDVGIKRYLVDFSGKDESLEDLLINQNVNPQYSANYLFTLNKEYDNLLEEQQLKSLYYDVELPLSNVLYDMEINGFKIDVNTLENMSKVYNELIGELLTKIQEEAGEQFNPNSTKQLGYILFEKLGLKHSKKTKTGYSTSAETLEEIQNDHKIVPLILRYRQITKLCSTYVDGFKPLINKKTGYIHTVFNQTLTSTGRLSSKEPNLQNIPVRDEEGKELRKMFIPSFENGYIVSADYSQIELRLLAHFSGSKELIDAYNTNKDIHLITASQVFGVSESEVTSEMRRNAKAVNFGIIYGISEYGLSVQLKISPKKAGEYIKKYFEMYPQVMEYMDNNVAFARENGYVKTLLGRRRYIKEINSSNYNLRSFGERAAKNMPLQGTSADIIKIAMIKVANRIKELNLKSKLILQVHDELIVDTCFEEKEVVCKILKEEMENAVELKVPLTVDVNYGKNWYEAK